MKTRRKKSVLRFSDGKRGTFMLLEHGFGFSSFPGVASGAIAERRNTMRLHRLLPFLGGVIAFSILGAAALSAKPSAVECDRYAQSYAQQCMSPAAPAGALCWAPE
jgi:hypothetical protein